MTLAHVHLLLNHVPTVGTAIVLGLFLLAFIRKSDELKRVSLEAFFVIALLTLPAYLSGVAAQQEIQDRPDVSSVLIAAHADSAVLAFVLMQLTGGFAWLALWQLRRIARPARVTLFAVLLLSTLTMAVTARTATLGGEIRHPEILGLEAVVAEADLGSDPAWISSEGIGNWVTDKIWVWPAAEALHFIGLWLLFGIVLLVNLRLLGVMKMASFAAVHRLLPWAALGFAINAVTGMLFVTATPEQYAQNAPFLWKIVMLMFAGVNLLYVTVFEGPWHVGPGERAPLRAQAVAAAGIFMWVGVMYFGRMLPFLGNAF
jgi:uncharacterized membrane protein